MSEIEDIRWLQRLHNYERAIETLQRAAERASDADAGEFDQLALIKCWEMAHELAWNLLKDYLTAEGEAELGGSRRVTRLAIERGLLPAGTQWMDMIDCRNLTVHAYDASQASEIAQSIRGAFVGEMAALRRRFNELAAGRPA